MIFDIGDWITKNIASIVSLSVAASSLVLSYLNYKRDSGRLDVSISLVSRLGGIPVRELPGGLSIKIINSGRRPLIVNSLGAEDRLNSLRRVLDFIFGDYLPSWLQPKGVSFFSPVIVAQLSPEGIPRVLKEGESIDIFMEDPNGTNLVKSFINKYPVFMAHDSMNRRFKSSSRTIKKLKKMLRD